MAPDVRVGIVSWNTADLLDRCLAALPLALGRLVAEVVVVDNASDDDSAAVAERHGVRVVRNARNEGYARGMNAALADAEAEVLVALNPDTEPPPGSIEVLVARLRATPEAGLVAPRLVHPDGRPQPSAYRFPSVGLAAAVCFTPPAVQRGAFGERWLLEAAPGPAAAGPVDWVIGAVHVIRRAALDGAPPYSEQWFMYAEDLELCWRLSDAGWRTWLVPEVVVPHAANASGAQAWGSARDERWWRASYDALVARRGIAATRRWAGVNLAGAALHAVVLRGLGVLPGRRRGERRARAAALRRVLPIHAQALRHPDHVGLPARRPPDG